MKSREKTLLLVLGVLLIGTAFYYLVYSPIDSKGNELRRNIASIKSQISEIKTTHDKEIIIKEIEKLKLSNDVILNKYPSLLTEENPMRLFIDMEKEIEDVKFNDITFKPIQILKIADENYVEKANTVADNNYKNKFSECDFNNKKLDKDIIADKEGLESGELKEKDVSFCQSVEFGVIVNYENLKKILDYINSYHIKTVVDDISIRKEDEDGVLGVNMNLRMIGISSSTNTNRPSFDSVPKGRDELFEPSEDKSSLSMSMFYDKLNDKNTPRDERGDLFININPVSSDDTAQKVGMLPEKELDSIRLDENKVVQVDITVLKEDDKYIARYYMNGITKKAFFERGNAIEVDVYSSLRDGDNDKSGVILNLRNDIDEILYINVYDDDKDNPRFDTGITEGKYLVR